MAARMRGHFLCSNVIAPAAAGLTVRCYFIGVARAFAFVSARLDFLDREPGLADAAGEVLARERRPDGKDAAGLEGAERDAEACVAVEPVVAGSGQAVGAIVDVEQDRIELRAARGDRVADVAIVDDRAGISEAARGQRGHR